MYKIKIIALGKFKEQAYRELESEYVKRLSPFAKLTIVEIPEVSYGTKQDIDRVKLEEAEKIQKNVSDGSTVILLEESGKQYDSPAFAKFLDQMGSTGNEITFVLGSGVGLHPSLKTAGAKTFSLSPLTFPHNMARVVLEEQIYRACTISAGKEYHK